MPYIPYFGGGGPTDQQVLGNNLVLLDSLKAVGFLHARLDEKRTEEPPDVIVRIRHVTYTVGYDRWGFVIDQIDEADQLTLDATIEALLDVRDLEPLKVPPNLGEDGPYATPEDEELATYAGIRVDQLRAQRAREDRRESQKSPPTPPRKKK